MAKILLDKAFIKDIGVDKIYFGGDLVYMRTQGIPIERLTEGVYILSTDNLFYTKENWNVKNNSNAVGVVVVDKYPGKYEYSKILISADSTSLKYSASDDLVSGVTTAEWPASFDDYNGQDNTKALVAFYGNTSNYAAGWCANYVFKNSMKGYLGGLGEWGVIRRQENIVNDCLTHIGGIAFGSDKYWSSTQSRASNAHYVSFGSTYNDANKTNIYKVKSFALL